LTELSSTLSLAALVISVLIGLGTLRRRAHEPNERRWREFEAWKTDVDAKLDRDYRSINRADKKIGRHEDFEQLMLRSMLGILEHLASGNHVENLRDVSRQINEYLIEGAGRGEREE
jgi:hypothetical protein